jgi:hypothetical protein
MLARTAGNLFERGISFSENSPSNKARSASFVHEWNLLCAECGVSVDAGTAWKAFEPVMTNSYASETTFSRALLKALHGALGGTFEWRDDSFFLPGTNVGFAREVSRESNLGFPPTYGRADRSICDHACVFVHAKDGSNFTCYDVTASVELKMSDTSCKEFQVQVDEDGDEVITRAPNLQKEHGPLGQAILYTLDTLHCLARRGVLSRRSPISLPVLIIAGKRRPSAKRAEVKKAKSVPRDSSRAKYLCCVEATLHVPEDAGGAFEFDIDSHIPFGTIDDAKRAIALYLRTLRTGLKYAKAIESQYLRGPVLPPVSLCCVNLQIGDFKVPELALLASPIPYAQEISSFKIAQGEFFTFKNEPGWLERIGRDGATLFGISPSARDGQPLVKISCASVHNILVS